MSREKTREQVKEQLRLFFGEMLKADDDLINRVITGIKKEWPGDPIGEEFVRQLELLRKLRPANN